MGIMNKMRERTAVILWVLVIAFGGIWVFTDSGALDVIGKENPIYVGYVDGEGIATDEYKKALDGYLAQVQQNGQQVTSGMRDQYGDLIFTSLVERKIRDRELKRLGIKVTDAEVADMVFGANPDEIIMQSFNDGKGGINRTQLKNFWNSAERREQVLQIQDYLREKRAQQKLDKLLEASVTVSDADVTEAYLRRNQNFQAEIIALRYADLQDKYANVTDEDIRSFYNEHREEFKRKKTFKFNFVSVPTTASAADTARVLGEITPLKDAFRQTTSNADFLTQNASAAPFDSTFKPKSAFGPKLGAAIFANLTPGTVIGPIAENGDVQLVKVLKSKTVNKSKVRASHILVKDEAKANELLAKLKAGADFAQLAKENSEDKGSGAQGGDLGEQESSIFVAEFKQAIDSAPLNQIVGPVKTQFGYHIIKVASRNSSAETQVQLAQLVRPVDVGADGLSAIQEKLGDFQYYATESKNFGAEAKKYKYTVQTTSVEENAEVIPIIGRSRSLMNWLADAKEGAISDVVEMDDRFVVAQLTQVLPEGYKSVEEVKSQLTPRVKIEKKKTILEAKFKNALTKNGFGASLAAALHTNVTTVSNVSAENALVQELGREPKLVGALSALNPGKTSGVMTGENGVYMVKLISKGDANASSLTKEAKDALRGELRAQAVQTLKSKWMQGLKDKANIEDKRRKLGL